MKATNIFIAFLLVAASCTKEKQLFTGSFIEFDKQTLIHGISLSRTGLDTLFIPISVIGSAFPADQLLRISPDSLCRSYMLEGYISLDTNVVFPSGAYSTVHPIIINSDKFSFETSIKFNIALASQNEIAENYRRSEIGIYRQKLIDLFSGNYYCSESGYGNKYIVRIQRNDAISDTLKIKNFWDFTPADTEIKFVVSRNETRSIDLPEQYFSDISGDEYSVSGKGAYENNGDFYIDYILTLKNATEPFESGRQTYTPAR